MDDKTYKIISTNNYFGELVDFIICWETVCMTCTFAVGFQTDKQNELSIFYVTNIGEKDIYNILDICHLEVYQRCGFSIEEKVKKEMKKVIARVLTTRVEAGIITIEQIKKWAEHEHKIF